jgi:hypothetical protein
VSKLCCPTCWELLDILRGSTNLFNVRGRNTTLYPVELPLWLPDNAVEQMLTRFKAILLEQLYTLERDHKFRLFRTPSQDSISGMSTASRDSEYPEQVGMVTYDDDD